MENIWVLPILVFLIWVEDRIELRWSDFLQKNSLLRKWAKYEPSRSYKKFMSISQRRVLRRQEDRLKRRSGILIALYSVLPTVIVEEIVYRLLPLTLYHLTPVWLLVMVVILLSIDFSYYHCIYYSYPKHRYGSMIYAFIRAIPCFIIMYSLVVFLPPLLYLSELNFTILVFISLFMSIWLSWKESDYFNIMISIIAVAVGVIWGRKCLVRIGNSIILHFTWDAIP